MAKKIPMYTDVEFNKVRSLFEAMFGKSNSDQNTDYIGLHWNGAKVQANFYRDGWIVVHIERDDMPVTHFQTKRVDVVFSRFQKWLVRAEVIAQKRIEMNYNLISTLKKVSRAYY